MFGYCIEGVVFLIVRCCVIESCVCMMCFGVIVVMVEKVESVRIVVVFV